MGELSTEIDRKIQDLITFRIGHVQPEVKDISVNTRLVLNCFQYFQGGKLPCLLTLTQNPKVPL